MTQISVIVPIYNTEKYLDRCIQSILAQTYSNIELLLVDDGSTDSSGAICDKYAEQDSRVRVFHKPNGGVSSARNMGLDNAKGEWIGWVDSDDYIDEDMYEQLYNAAMSKNVDIAYCNYRTELFSSNMPSDSLSKGDFLNQYLLYVPTNSLWITLAKKTLYNNIRFNEKANLGEDLLISSKLYYFSKSRILVPKALYFYTDTPFSLTKTVQPKQLEGLLKNVIELYRFFNRTSIYSDLKETLAGRILSTKQYYIYKNKDITHWYSLCSWTHKFIFHNKYNGMKGKIIEWSIVKLYRFCLKLTMIKIL